MTRLTARLATAAYASIYFVWFAGSTHSSYAGELLFAPLLFLFMLRYRARLNVIDLTGVAVSFALAAGVRPSDGIFLAPLFFLFVLRWVPGWRHRMFTICLAALLCLAWFIPQQLALRELGPDNASRLWALARRSAPILHGPSKLAISNVVRVAVPLLLAFWSLALAILSKGEKWIRPMLWVWIGPGLAFFTLVYVSDATYFCFLVPAIILLAATAQRNGRARAGLAICFTFNVMFFCVARPVHETRSLPLAIYSVSGARYCLWALKHQWYQDPGYLSRCSGDFRLCQNFFAQEFESFKRDCIRVRSEVAPNGCRGRQSAQREAKPFDCEPAIVANFAQGIKKAAPFNMAAPGNSAVVLARVNVS